MAMRLSRSVLGAARLRPTTALLSSTLPAHQVRHETNYPPPTEVQSPETKAKSILDSLPGNSLVSKTAILSGTAGLSIAAISQEILVINEEAVVAISLLAMYAGVFRLAGPLYGEWARGQSQKFREIFAAAKTDHVSAVKERITNVEQMQGVVEITKNLFEVSKETAKTEAEVFELEQRTNFANEAKQVLDSWVRYEAQVKQREQRELAETLIGKIQKELENPKTLQQILQQSVTDVERIITQAK